MNNYHFLLLEKTALPNKSVKLTESFVSYIISSSFKYVSDEPGIISIKLPPNKDDEVILAEESSGLLYYHLN